MDSTGLAWNDRAHFFAIAARMMRRILVDSARRFRSEKRGEGLQVTLDERAQGIDGAFGLSELDEALEDLHALDERQCSIVELRFFGGLSIEECAGVLEISTRTVNNDWLMAKAWLFRRLSPDARP
jgi:RNA polymerase sigma factor (TIGR02999 family)